MIDEAGKMIGHNNPPDSIFERADELVRNCNRWVAERPQIKDDEQASAAQLFIDQLLGTRTDLQGQQATELEPFETEIALVKSRYRDPMALLDLALGAMRAKAATWLQKKRDQIRADQIARENAAKLARDQAAELARAAAQESATVEDQLAAKRAESDAAQAEKDAERKPTRAQIKGDYAAKAMSLRSTWHAKVVDETKALKSYAKFPTVRAAALAAALKEASALARKAKRADAAPSGFEFYSNEKAL